MHKIYAGTVDMVRDPISYNTLILLPQNTLKHDNNIIIRFENSFQYYLIMPNKRKSLFHL